MLKTKIFFLVLAVWSWCPPCGGHVSLTFPAARQFPIDFLNSFWTKLPCGMPKGHIKTSLVAGKGFNATWHLGFAHLGGYKLELLDQNENKLMDLTPSSKDGEFYNGHNTAQSHFVQLPENSSCSSCTIRLLRQVPEFSPDFHFISCADVDIVPKYRYVEGCSGNGHLFGGRCTCYSRHWGDRCQYEDECDTALDCNGVGRCVDLGGSALPRKQCYCPQTHFGKKCNVRNPPSLPNSNNLDLKKHVRVKLDERFTLYFKIFLGQYQSQDEIEFVLKINGTSYGGIGWRPFNLGPICKSWPFYPNALRGSSSSSSSSHSQHQHHRVLTKRSPNSSNGFTIIRATDVTADFPPQTKNNYYPPEEGVTIVGRSISSGDSIPSNTYQTVNSKDLHQVQNSPRQEHHYNFDASRIELIQPIEYQTKQKTNANLHKTSRVTTTTTKKIHQGSGSSSHPPTTKPPPRTPSEWAAGDPFTPMDCSDIITASARGSYSKFSDSYSRGRHTPLPDSVWGGRDDLSGAVGWEFDGVTTLVFRRRMDSSDAPDHSIRGDMQIIWARGQEAGEPAATPYSSGNPTISNFYTRDELKYHGLGTQRGYLYIDFDTVKKEFINGIYSQ